MDWTPEKRINAHRVKLLSLSQVAKVLPEWFTALYEKGLAKAHASLSELDITARFENTEDKVISLFASLAAKENSDSFLSVDIWEYHSPRKMVEQRLFFDVSPSSAYSATRFKRIMDMLWVWSQEYYSLYDAFNMLRQETEPIETLMRMSSDLEIPNKTVRLQKLLMAMLVADEGIGQGIMVHPHPENLTVPLTKEVLTFKKDFCPVAGVSMGEFAHALGLPHETDLYYAAIGWKDICSQWPRRAKGIRLQVKNVFQEGGRNIDHNSYLRYCLRRTGIL